KTEMVHVDEHLKVRENVLQGPNRKAVSIMIDDDLHIDEEEEYRKNENFGKDLHQTPPSTSSQA
nr:tracheary element differentiation-related 6 [Tanacetum cinerariifolium]